MEKFYRGNSLPAVHGKKSEKKNSKSDDDDDDENDDDLADDDLGSVELIQISFDLVVIFA